MTFLPGSTTGRADWQRRASLLNNRQWSLLVTELYDQRGDEVSFSEIERVGI
jgi:hypothetical protein